MLIGFWEKINGPWNGESPLFQETPNVQYLSRNKFVNLEIQQDACYVKQRWPKLEGKCALLAKLTASYCLLDLLVRKFSDSFN